MLASSNINTQDFSDQYFLFEAYYGFINDEIKARVVNPFPVLICE